MNRVVITGATSMIGVALVNECIKNETEVLAIVREKSPHIDRLPKSELIKVYESDLETLNSVEEIDGSYDVFYHMAWSYTSKEHRDDSVLQERNIKYTLDAVNLAKRLGCKKFIGAGSQAEYGKVNTVITPSTPVNPLISYGMAKYAAGMLSRKLCEQYGMTHIWARIFSVYGRYDTEGSMLSYAIAQFLKGEPADFSAATQMWDFLHESDAGKIFYLMGQRVEDSKVYCVASGDCRRLKEYIWELSACFGDKTECRFAPENVNIQLVSLQPDISDLVKDIGYSPKVCFSEGIKDMIDYREQMYKMPEI